MASNDDKTLCIWFDNFVVGYFPQALLLKCNYLKKSFNNIYASEKSQKQFQQKKTKLT